MRKVIFRGWNEGFEKVTLTKLQMNILGMSLKESKTNVDSILDDKLIEIKIENVKLADQFLKEIQSIGVIYTVETDS